MWMWIAWKREASLLLVVEECHWRQKCEWLETPKRQAQSQAAWFSVVVKLVPNFCFFRSHKIFRCILDWLQFIMPSKTLSFSLSTRSLFWPPSRDLFDIVLFCVRCQIPIPSHQSSYRIGLKWLICWVNSNLHTLCHDDVAADVCCSSSGFPHDVRRSDGHRWLARGVACERLIYKYSVLRGSPRTSTAYHTSVDSL